MMEKLSVIVPVFNEVAILERFFARLDAAACLIEREIIAVDDGSTDGSRELLRKLTAKNEAMKIVLADGNRGKGAAVREGVRHATGDLIMIQDADFEYDPGEVPGLLEPLLEGSADAVYGSRFKQSGQQVHRTYHYAINRMLTVLSNLLSGIYLTDMETCYKIFRADLLRSMNLVSDRFGIDIELTAYLAKTRARVFELPISYRPRSRLQGKKIGWKDGVAALYHLLRFNARSFRHCFTSLPEEYLP